jgi:hypothetical protein
MGGDSAGQSRAMQAERAGDSFSNLTRAGASWRRRGALGLVGRAAISPEVGNRDFEISGVRGQCADAI